MSNNVPNLRFKGYKDEWREKSLGDIVKFYDNMRKPIKEDERKDGIYPYYGATGVIDYIDDYIFDGEYLLLGEDGANIVTRNAPLIYITKGKFWVNNHAHIFKPMKQYCLRYLGQYLEIINYVPYNTGTAQPKLNIENVKKILVKLPSLEEQEKIANFLTKVDKIIEKQEEKVSNLESYKKGMMKKIFSQEIRFKDENGEYYSEWSKKRLGEVCNIIGGGTPSTTEEEFWNGNIQWFTPTEIKNSKYVGVSNRTITELGLKRSSAKILPKGTILLTTRATLGEMAILKCEATTNQGFQSLVAKNNVNNEFVYYMKDRIKKYCYINASGSTFLEISKSSLEKLKLNLPCFEEQSKIANFLSKIDSIVEKEKEKLEELRLWKKGLLQQMFV